MIPIDAASKTLNPSIIASPIVRNIPIWAVSPNKKTLGLEIRGAKSHIAPTAININNGNISVEIPSLNNIESPPSTNSVPIIWSIAEERGRFAKMVPNPIGSRRHGSKFFFIARYIKSIPIKIISMLSQVTALIILTIRSKKLHLPTFE